MKARAVPLKTVEAGNGFDDLKYLVTERCFGIFSIEANMPEAYALNDCVLTGKGDPAA